MTAEACPYGSFMCCQRLPSRDGEGDDTKQFCKRELAPALHKPSNRSCIVAARVIFACLQPASPCLLAQHRTMCLSYCLVPAPGITRHLGSSFLSTLCHRCQCWQATDPMALSAAMAKCCTISLTSSMSIMLNKQQSVGSCTTPETNALMHYLSWEASHDNVLLHIQPAAGEECSNAADL